MLETPMVAEPQPTQQIQQIAEQYVVSPTGSMWGGNWAVLSFEDAIAQMDRTLGLFRDGHINYMIFDLETAPELEPWRGEIIMFSWAHMADERGFCVPLKVNNNFAHDAKDLPYSIPVVPFDITPEQKALLIAKIKELLLVIPIGGHNIKYDVKWGIWHGWMNILKLKIMFDTLTIAFQLFNKTSKEPSLSLDSLTNKYCGVNDQWKFNVQDYLNRFKRVKDRHYGNLPTGLLGPYSGKDSIYNRHLRNTLMAMMPPTMIDITNTVTYAIKPFSDLETKGLCIDQNMKAFLRDSYQTEQDTRLNEIKNLPIIKSFIDEKLVHLRAENDKKKKSKMTEAELYEEAFNISSNKHLGELIYGEKYYAIPVMNNFKTEKGAPQVNKEFIEFYLKKLEGFDFEAVYATQLDYLNKIQIPSERDRELRQFQDEFGRPREMKTFLQNLAIYKRLEKLKTTYIDPVDDESHEGSYKPEFSLNFVKTGRLSSGFHTLPKGCDIKRLYISRWENEGGLFLAVDQSQLELRVVAALAGETQLIDAFKQGLDAHRLTASNIYKLPMDQITDQQRNVGKTTNFAVLFGKMAKNLAEDLKCSEEEAQKVLDGFFSGYDKLTAWMKEQNKFVKANGFVITPWGRRLPVEEATSPDKWVRMKSDRLSVNYPVQSSASDIVLTGVNGTWNRLKHIDRVKSLLVGSVHDSIELDVYPGELFKCLQILQEECVDKIMATQSWLTCPIELSIELGKSWGGALECEVEYLDAERFTFKSKGLRKDFNALRMIADRAYKIGIEVLNEEPVNQAKVGKEIFVRDATQWTAKVTIEKK